MGNEFGGLPGTASFVSLNLTTGERFERSPGACVNAASLIKLYVMAAYFLNISLCKLSSDEVFILHDSDKLPSCGALNLIGEGARFTALDLIKLMICLSDNTATNLLIDRIGMDAVNDYANRLGCRETALNRKLFDAEAAARGISNTTSARDCALFFEKLWHGEVVSAEYSALMLDILRQQKLGGKLPFYLKPRGAAIAHKTGEDDGITHDCGLIYAKQPFVLCCCTMDTDVPRAERAMQDMALRLFERWNR